MEKKQDLRIIKTREAIKEAFIQLVAEKGFEALTVKDLTEKARINRGTFYAHYEDKYDCLASYEAEFMEGMVAIAKKHFPLNEVNDTLPISIEIFQYLYQHKELLKVLLSPKGDPYFQNKLKRTMWEQLFEKTTVPLVNPSQMLVPPKYFVSYVSGAHLSVIQAWLHNGCKETPEEMARILSTLLKLSHFSMV